MKKVFPTKSKSTTKIVKEEKVSEFSTYFSSIVADLKQKSFKLVDFVWRQPRKQPPKTNCEFRFGYVSNVFIRKQLKSIKRKKATSLDELPATVLKDCADCLSPIVTHIINLSITTSTFPELWKKARVTPIHKSGSVDKPENYRPILVLPILLKICERAIHSQVVEYLENHKLLSETQYGYRKKRSTEQAAIVLCDEIRKKVQEGKLVGVVFLDLSRAFDTINHATLVEKLTLYGIKDKELDWFKSYLFNRKQLVEIDGVRSNEESVTSGVPQWSILGPVLFLLFFDTIADCLRHSQIIMYADDTVLYLSDKDIDTINSCINEDMELISNYCYQNELILNMKKGKTESMLLGTAQRLKGKEIEIRYRGELINSTERYTYLGNILDPTLTLNDDFQRKYKKSSKRVNLLTKMKPFLTQHAVKKIYTAMVLPVVTYCSNLHLIITKYQDERLESLERRGSEVVGVKLVPIKNVFKRNACVLYENVWMEKFQIIYKIILPLRMMLELQETLVLELKCQ